VQGEDVPDDEIFSVLSAQDSLIVGSPDTCRRKLRAYADIGIDRMMCLQQMGSLAHDDVLTSIRLIGDLIAEFDRD
jgi:alkanesulfonate monooxygenase SsuD/methylene tetrahydromethanopterin reductase-like flavin-dependent oxidoreductase (luciferase family)